MAAGGVGEAMLIGAAVGATAGGAGAAIQGGDPLKGALMGGATGAIGGGIGGALAPAAEVANAGITAAAPATTTVSGAVPAGMSGTGITSSFTPATTSSIFSGAGQSVNAATQLGGGISGAGTGSGFGLTAGAAPAVSTAPISSGVAAAPAGGVAEALSPTTQSLAESGNQSIFNRPPTPSVDNSQNNAQNVKNIFGYRPGEQGYLSNTQLGMTAGTAGLSGAMQAERAKFGQPTDKYNGGNLKKLKYDPNSFTASTPTYAPESVYRPTYAAEGGIMKLAQGGIANPGPVEQMSQNIMGGTSNMYPQSQQEHTNFATPTQMPASAEVIQSDYDTKTNPYTGVATANMASGGVARFDMGGMAMGLPSGAGTGAGAQAMADQGIAALAQAGKKRMLTKEQMDAIGMQGMTKPALQDVYGQMAAQNLAGGGMANLGGYSDGGRMLKGPGDGMSDNIPATIAGKQPARLADGEFVIPADVVSHLGNGSTDAGAKQLYAMMNRVRKARTGNSKQGKQIKPAKYMVA